MGVLGTPKGLFNLHDSDRCVGSYISKDDCKIIFQVGDDDLAELQFQNMGNISVIDERKLQKAWKDGKIVNAPPCSHSSMDELILLRLIANTLPGACIACQQRIGKFTMDLKVTYGGVTKYIEFDGPSHFANSRYGPPRHPPFRKRDIIEDKTGIEVVNWAYWIQRCAANIRVLFDESVKGYGVLWSTNIHFGDFVCTNPAEVIEEINQKFKCIRDDGVGYFYGPETDGRNNPEHPIVEQVVQGNEAIERLLPKGNTDRSYWLPPRLRSAP